MLSGIWAIIGRILCVLFSVILSVLIWKTAEYFTMLPDTHRYKPLIAWDVLMLFLMLALLIVRLIIV
jgi:hypothetical protein